MNDWSVGTLKELMDVQLKEIDRRLGDLNHSHELAREKELTFVSRETYLDFARRTGNDVSKEQFNIYTTKVTEDFVAVRKEIQSAVDLARRQREDMFTNLTATMADKLDNFEARCRRIERGQSMMIGALVLVGAIVPIASVIMAYILHS